MQQDGTSIQSLHPTFNLITECISPSNCMRPKALDAQSAHWTPTKSLITALSSVIGGTRRKFNLFCQGRFHKL